MAIEQYLPIVEEILVEAGNRLCRYKFDFSDEIKLNVSPVTKLDKWMSDYLKEQLFSRTKIMVFTEEDDNPKIRNEQETFWWVDPIDGTKEFANGSHYFSISAGLIHNYKPVIGVVYRPHEFEQKLY